MKLIKLDKDYEIKLKSQVANFLDPDYVYIPIENRPLPFKKNEEVKKGSELFKGVFSPISGNILGITDCMFYSGKMGKCLVIANNYQEKLESRVATRKKMDLLSKEEILENVIDVDVQKLFSTENVAHFIISGIDEEPYLANEIFIQKENTKVILETIDALLGLYTNSKAHIVIKNTDRENIESYTNFLGTYQNIELHLVEDLYLIGKEENIVEKLHIKENYIYLKASEIYKIYYNLKKKRPMLEKYITITGDGITDPQVFNVKIGTKVMDILRIEYALNPSEYAIYVNGIMKGERLDIDALIVTKELEGIVIMKKKEVEEKECIKCGKCIEVCPIHSNPIYAYQTHKKIDCIECGLCSYICPSYIHLRKYIRGEVDE